MTTSVRHRSGLPPAAVASILQVLHGYPQIERIVLYGSRAKGNFRPGSDIDLCLVAPALGLRDLLEIDGRLDDLLLPWKIDLSLRHQIDNPELLEHIDRVGIPLEP
jgi:predicted nucleotidyltransferase